MTSRYTHLQPEDRLTVASLVQQGLSQRAIARLLGRSPSTICRELARDGSSELGYAFKPAQAACERRRAVARPCPELHAYGALWCLICDLRSADLALVAPANCPHICGACIQMTPASMCRTRRSTTPSMSTRVERYANSSLPCCARARALAGHVRLGRTGASKFPRW